MSDAKEMAFQRGMAMLAASGAIYAVWKDSVIHTSPEAQYALDTPEGRHGTLETVVHKQKLSRAKGVDRRSWAYTGYITALSALQVGEVWNCQCTDKKEAQGLQRAATGNAGKLWGPGNFISTVSDKHCFEILRVL